MRGLALPPPDRGLQLSQGQLDYCGSVKFVIFLCYFLSFLTPTCSLKWVEPIALTAHYRL